jgi:tRNA A37 threonylcarbamoyladenosine biosynthesis protein TsaE
MLKPHKIGNKYHIIDIDNIQKNQTQKLDGSHMWQFVQVIEWDEQDEAWYPDEYDYIYVQEESREVTWLELLTVTGQSKRQALWEHKACFGVPELDEGL